MEEGEKSIDADSPWHALDVRSAFEQLRSQSEGLEEAEANGIESRAASSVAISSTYRSSGQSRHVSCGSTTR